MNAEKECIHVDKKCRDGCPCTCAECFFLGDSIPDWPRRKECKKLEEKLKMTMEDEGGVIVENK